jgi:hypothetical protein
VRRPLRPPAPRYRPGPVAALSEQAGRGYLGIKPGWARVSFNYFISDAVAPGAAPQRAARRPGRPRPGAGAGEDALAGYLRQARALLGAAGPFTPVAGPSWLPPELERLRDFHLPGDAAS